MKNIYSARIIYKVEESVQAVYLKEFLMLYGIYVIEYVVENNDNLLSSSQMVDLNIMFSEICLESKKIPSKYNITIFPKEYYNDSLATIDARTQFGEKIKKVFINNSTIKNLFGDQKEFEKIWDIFIEQDYAYRDYWCHSLVTEMTKEEIIELQKFYVNCMDSICLEPQLKGGVSFQYAYLTCARKYEYLCFLNRQTGYFSFEKMMEQAKNLKDIDSSFSIGYALAGIIGLRTNQTWTKGESYILYTLKNERCNEYMAFLCYILGDFYEWGRRDIKRALYMYNRMNLLVPKNHRALYKIACEKYKNEKEKEAYDIFLKIYNSMDIKNQHGWIKPQEIEYYYKCATLISYMEKNSDSCRGYCNVMKEDIEYTRDKAFLNSKFVNNFLEKEQIDNYQSMLAKKMDHYARKCYR